MIATMKQSCTFLNALVAASLTFTSLAAGAGAVVAQTLPQSQQGQAQVIPVQAQVMPVQAVPTEELLRELARPDQERWVRLERQILRRWARSGSAAIDYLYGRGQAALHTGQAEDAIAHFSAVIDHDPDFAEGWNGRATAYFMINRLGQSLADIEQVLIRNPQHFGALAGLGMILEQLDRPEAARAAYQASLAVHPHQTSVLDAVARLDLATAGAAL